jgi:hypothetical protein
VSLILCSLSCNLLKVRPTWYKNVDKKSGRIVVPRKRNEELYLLQNGFLVNAIADSLSATLTDGWGALTARRQE